MRSIIGLRHSLTNKADRDELREVTPEGYAQIKKTQELLKEKGWLENIDSAFFGTLRHQQTLLGILDGQSSEDSLNLIKTPTLYFPENPEEKELISALHRKYGATVPLTQWLNEGAALALLKYGTKAMQIMLQACDFSGGEHVFFVGSFNLINMICLQFALYYEEAMDEKIVDVLATACLKECEGFRLDFSGDELILHVIYQDHIYLF